MKALIIEDETLIARELIAKIGAVAPDVEIVQAVHSVKTALRWLAENEMPDVVFADIQLSDGTSFEIFEQIKVHAPVIFTTAYDEFAIRAFKVNGIGYLLKPVDTQELKMAIDRCRQLAGHAQPYLPLQALMEVLKTKDSKPLYKEKFIVKFRNQWTPVKTSDIACFVRDLINYIYTFDGEKYPADFTTLEEVEELLDPAIFFRANRQCIVHTDAIKHVKALDNQKLMLTLKEPLKMQQDVSREKAPAFKKWFEGH